MMEQGEKVVVKELPQGDTKRRILNDLKESRWRPKPQKCLGLLCELDGTQAPWTQGNVVSLFYPNKDNPKTEWDSPRGLVPIPKKAPPWVGTTPSQRPYSAYIRRITPHLWPFLYSKIHSHSLAFAHSHLGSKEHVPFWFLSLFWWFWGVVPICPNSVSTCPNSELWILVFPNFGIVVSFCGYNEI